MDTTAYLQEELRKAERSFRIAAIAMAVVLVVFVGYFQWMKSALADILRPVSVAEFMVNQTRSALPEITDSLKANLSREAPEVVNYVLHRAVDEVLPLVGQSFQDNLAQYSRDVNELADAQVMSAFEGALLAYKNSKVAKNQEPKVFASRLSAHIEAELGPQMDSVAKDAIKSRLDRSGETLKHINAELSSLATSRVHGDRESEMGKSLITTWWTFLDRGRPKVPGSEMAASAPPKTMTRTAK